MPTQFQKARQGVITPVMEAVAAAEQVSPERVRVAIATGRAVLPANPTHLPTRPAIVGRDFRTKVNANIGRSTVRSSLEEELTKLRTALEAGADFVMDLSVGPDLAELRRRLLAACPVPFGTVPLYEAMARAGHAIAALTPTLLLDVIREHAEHGVDFMTLHAGLLREHIPLALTRRLGIVSRGGAILAQWMVHTGRQNPLLERWDDVLALCAQHDVTVSLGDGLRPGCLADASDAAQFAELETIGLLVQRCRMAGVQVMVEGPGHLPLNEVAMNVEREQRVCDGAPFYVLGPVVTDIAPGYDHVAGGIGACLAAYHGASLLCYVTPTEHLGLPTAEDVRQGVIASRLAAHAADVARGLPSARAADDAMAEARRNVDWPRQFALALDPSTAQAIYERSRGGTCEPNAEYCSMCGRDFCSLRANRELRRLHAPGSEHGTHTV